LKIAWQKIKGEGIREGNSLNNYSCIVQFHPIIAQKITRVTANPANCCGFHRIYIQFAGFAVTLVKIFKN
jgi:hypothetical protein